MRKRLNQQQRIWIWLKKQPEPVSVRDIRNHFGNTARAARSALWRLQAKGCVETIGRTVATKYRAIGSYPQDNTGKHPASQAALIAQKPNPRSPDRKRAVYQPSHALDLAWPIGR